MPRFFVEQAQNHQFEITLVEHAPAAKRSASLRPPAPEKGGEVRFDPLPAAAPATFTPAIVPHGTPP
jgi:hypothetical protein